MPPFVEMQQPHWNRFLRQLKVAAGDASDVKDLWAKILEPMRAEWAHRLPGSRLPRTVKVRKKTQGEIWAGYPRISDNRPFLPWLEFGGRIGFKPGDKAERVPIGGEFRTVYSVYRQREPDGRWLAPTVSGKKDDIARQFAEGVQEIFEKHFT